MEEKNKQQVLAAMLRAARTYEGMRQIDLANVLNVQQTVVSRWEQGLRAVTVVELKQITDALGVDARAFYDEFLAKTKS